MIQLSHIYIHIHTFMTTNLSLIGAHASALMKLRATSLAAYGIDPKSLILHNEYRKESSIDRTRALAQTKKEERALAVQEDHSLMVL